MADNATAVNGGSPVTFATDDIGGVNYPRFKITFGVDGVATDVSAGSPLPVTGTIATGGLTDAQLRASAVPVSLASQPLPTGASTEATLSALNGKFSALGQAVMASSSPVVIASNQSAIPVTLANDTITTFTQAGVIAINTDLLIIDCQGIEAVSIHCTSMGTTGVVTPAWSNTNVTAEYVNQSIMTPAGVAAATFNAAGMWVSVKQARFLRLRLTTATTAGTTTINVLGIAQGLNFPVQVQPVSGTVTVGTLPATPAGTNLIGDVGFQYRANATGAATTFKFASAATVNNVLILTGARRLLGWSLTNTTAAYKYFRFYNKATAPTSGESPTFMIGIPPNSTVVSPPIVGGISMTLGLGVACTNGVTDTDATVTAVNDVIGFVNYA